MLGEASSPFCIPVTGQCDNVKIHEFSKFEQNAPIGSRVMSIFTKRARSAKMMLGEASSHFFHISCWTMLKYINKQNLNQIHHVIQE